MKFNVTLLLLFGFIQFHAQSIILFQQDSIAQTYQGVDLSDNFIDFAADLFFKNNTNETIAVNWRREFADNCPLEWDIATSDQVISYTPDINESQIPIELSPTDSNFIIRQIFFPRMVAGCCDVKVIFSLEGSPEMAIDTGYYSIKINADDCGVTTTFEERLPPLQFFPNPANEIIHFENGHLIESFAILDLNGKIHLAINDFRNQSIDISRIPRGIYYCQMKSKLGTVEVKKLIRE